STKRLAVARPIPLLPPVTTATFPWNFGIEILLQDGNARLQHGQGLCLTGADGEPCRTFGFLAGGKLRPEISLRYFVSAGAVGRGSSASKGAMSSGAAARTPAGSFGGAASALPDRATGSLARLVAADRGTRSGSISRTGPSQSTTARSITFWSSRTFPGHSEEQGCCIASWPTA